LIDLRVSPKPVPEPYLKAIGEMLAERENDAGIDDVVIIE
jgi:hypothetical protein